MKDDFESWYNLDSLGESSQTQSTRSQEQKRVGEERRKGRSRSRERRDWLKRREERSRSRERRRSRSRERRKNWSKERRRSRSRGERWSREQRSPSRERWMGEVSRSGDRTRREEATRKSTSEDELEVEGLSGERTPSPSSCARLPPHLLGGWTVLPDWTLNWVANYMKTFNKFDWSWLIFKLIKMKTRLSKNWFIAVTVFYD